MNLLRSAVMTTATALSIAGFAPLTVSAADSTDPRSLIVKYEELDLTSSQGAAALYARLRSASKTVCAPLQGRELRQHTAFQDCYKQALSNAVVRVNRESVTALHQRATHNERAS